MFLAHKSNQKPSSSALIIEQWKEHFRRFPVTLELSLLSIWGMSTDISVNLKRVPHWKIPTCKRNNAEKQLCNLKKKCWKRSFQETMLKRTLKDWTVFHTGKIDVRVPKLISHYSLSWSTLGNQETVRQQERGVRDLSCYRAGLYTQIFVNHFPTFLFVHHHFFLFFYLIISAPPLPVEAHIHRNFLLQIPSAMTDVIDADIRVFAVLFWYRNLLNTPIWGLWSRSLYTLDTLWEWVGGWGCSWITCWGCHSSEPFSVHVSQTLQWLFDSNKSPAPDIWNRGHCSVHTNYSLS